ncbi:uncharacterized protein B0I36DRAFT_348390 [Microdochium trichocladiopsis]|uniref:Uncharacterized protein n=1 Tax=Microdochium trichocladiopsis TaxID=1682393 RepID=A0A9P8Y991_9PEZI|nr:uncharacterized protein B0I36DRAFT_348390 [Microdochium trichocladiopsis]KAH7033318.1 hypothetical protein B0I36DRAFT_348390 [Microdochium trichocladiopsis]
MFAARDQENLAFHRQNNAAMKQLQKTPGAQYPKTPIRVPLNDENAAHAIKGAKSIAGPRNGNENVLTSKANKGLNKSQFMTPMEPRSRAVLGDKTTNAKAKGLQSVNVKGAVRQIEQTASKPPATARPKQKQPQAETQRLQVHTEADDPLSEDEPEYCPPRPVDLPYESDVFPDGVLTFEALKPENMFKGYYQHYFNPIGEDGISLSDKRLAESTRRALEEGEKRIIDDMDSFEWATERELREDDAASRATVVKSPIPKAGPVKRVTTRGPALRESASNTMARRAASSLSIDDATKSLQRRTAVPVKQATVAPKRTGFVIPRLASTKAVTAKPVTAASRTTLERKGIEAASRCTIGFNKGRTTASMLNRGPAPPISTRPRAPIARVGSAVSRDSDKTVTPARFAKLNSASAAASAAAVEDAEWKERVPFLSIFAHDDDGVDDDFDLLGGQPMPTLDASDDEDFEIRILE